MREWRKINEFIGQRDRLCCVTSDYAVLCRRSRHVWRNQRKGTADAVNNGTRFDFGHSLLENEFVGTMGFYGTFDRLIRKYE